MSETEIYLSNLPLDTISIELNGKNLTSLPDLSQFTNLKCLIIPNNKFTILDNIPETIEYLDCQNSCIKEIVATKNIKTLFVNQNNLKSLSLPDGIEFVDAGENMLENIILPASVKYAELQCNDIKNVEFGANLEYLGLAINPITKLPDLKNIRSLNCNQCLLTEIKIDLHSSNLEELYCVENKIKKLALPETIRIVDADMVTLNIMGNDKPICASDFIENDYKS